MVRKQHVTNAMVARRVIRDLDVGAHHIRRVKPGRWDLRIGSDRVRAYWRGTEHGMLFYSLKGGLK